MPALGLEGRRVISIRLDAAWDKFLEVDVRFAPSDAEAEAMVKALGSLKTDADA